MDAAHLTEVSAIVTVLVGAIVIGVRTLDRAETGFASLFVPPDRDLPWPRGVQETDTPWGWRTPLEMADRPDGDLPGPALELEAAAAGALAFVGHSRYVAPPRRVAPITFRALPH